MSSNIKINTTQEFINSFKGNVSVGTIVATLGYSAVGDGGSAQWEKSATTGQTPSRTPIQLGDSLLNDASGNQWTMLLTNDVEFKTFAEIATLSIGNVYQKFTCRERGNALYITQPSSYSALAGDVTFANGVVGALQIGVSVSSLSFSTLQEANNRMAIIGGIVNIPAGIYETTQVIIDEGVTFVGAGVDATTIKLANGANADVFITRGFSTLTGSNTWLNSAGVPVGFGVKDFAIDGNRANNTAGAGLRFYGKKYNVENIYIFDCAEDGFYTECAAAGGQSSRKDAPESQIHNVWIRNCGGNGLTYRGPHDGVIGNLFPFLCGGIGASFEQSLGVYDGAADVGYIHTYANDVGLSNAARVNFNYIQTESNSKQGYICNSLDTQVTQLRAFKNWRDFEGSTAPVGSKNIEILNACKITNAKVRTDNGGIGISVTGSGTYIGYAEIDGENKGSVGLDIDANQVISTSRIYNFSIGTALRSGVTGGTNGNFTISTTRNSLTHFNNVSAGAAGSLSLDAFTTAGETFKSGVNPSGTESFNVVSRGDTSAQSKNTGLASLTIGATSTVVSHGLAYTPSVTNIKITPTSNLDGVSFWLSSVTATTFQINISATSVTTEFFSWSAKT